MTSAEKEAAQREDWSSDKAQDHHRRNLWTQRALRGLELLGGCRNAPGSRGKAKHGNSVSQLGFYLVLNLRRRREQEKVACPFLGALGYGDPGTGIDGADVVGAGADETVVVKLLDDVCGPAGDAADREDGCIEIDVDTQCRVR